MRHLLGDGVAVVGPGLEAELQTLEGLDGPEADRVRARLEAALAAALSRDIARPACLAHAERAVELARRTGDVAIELDALVSMVGIRPFEGDQEETIRLVGEVTRRGREQGLDDEAGRAYRLGGAACSEVFAYDHAERLLRDGIAFAEQHELWNHRCYMTAHLGLVLWATGRWPEADAVAVAALHEARGGVTTRVTGCYVRGYVALSEGRLGDARGLLDESLALGERSGDIIRLSLPLWGLAETALLEGRLEEAIELTERGRAVSARVDDAALLAPFVVTGTRARLASRGVLEAERWVADTGASSVGAQIATIQPAATHAEGLLALASGETGRARGSSGDAVRGWDEVRRSWEATWARLDLAACHLRSQRVNEAVELLSDARAVADALGSRPLAERAAQLLRDARGRRHSPRPGHR